MEDDEILKYSMQIAMKYVRMLKYSGSVVKTKI